MAMLQELGVRDTNCEGSNGTGMSPPQARELGHLLKQQRGKKNHKPKEAIGKMTPDKKSAQDGKPSSLRLDLTSSSSPVIVSDLIHSHLFCKSGCHREFLPCRWWNWGASSSSHVELPQDSRACVLCLSPPLFEGVQPQQPRIPSFPAVQSACCEPHYLVGHQELTKAKDDSFMRATSFQRPHSAVRDSPLDIPCLLPLNNPSYTHSAIVAIT